MQALTSGDQYSYSLVQGDGVTPLVMTNVASVKVAISLPGLGSTSQSTSVSLAGNVASFVTALTPTPTFPIAGTYEIQFIVTYISGAISKSRVYPQIILPSLV